MYKSRNILAAISGIAISIGALSTTAYANPKSFFIEGPDLANKLKQTKKLIKYRTKAKGFADEAEKFASDAEAKAEAAEDCCNDTSGADEARQYANQARLAAESAEEKAKKAGNTNKTSKAKDLKDKAKDFASQAKKAAKNAKSAFNYALEEQEEKLFFLKAELIKRAEKAVISSETSAVDASKAVSEVENCCSNQAVDGDISDIEDSREFSKASAEAAREAVSSLELVRKAKSYSEAEKFVIEAEIAAELADKASGEAIRTANRAKKYPDDFSDLKRRCGLKPYARGARIGYEIYNKKWEKKVRYKGFDYEEFRRKYC